ncbi:TetR/AcrR family transcriptional regulator [Fusobacterium russii]|uniref:TetR/AcrR family transcriptional regulator n=1 Tax=Fusobacterium russii TaxID=854 RepID=UPI0003A88727|nr:TetR/AcrR family transcriptional regulator [Fusobacterium russii]
MDKIKKTYHHKDLKNELIKKGIEIVNKEGINLFSLRKVATACKVSHAAPYSHFKNKEELLNKMQIYITKEFSEVLENSVKENKNNIELLKELGKTYVNFFIDNPSYYKFLYYQSDIKIDLNLSIADEKNYKPYIIYKNIVLPLFKNHNYSKEKQIDILITIWSFIHGLTALATTKNIEYKNDWKEKLNDFINIFQLFF